MEFEYRKISFERAKEILDTTPDAMMIDVRTEPEYFTGHAVDAVNFALDDIDAENALDIIPEFDTPLLVYCRSGIRSRAAVNKLAELGYTNIYDLGSLAGWPYGTE